MDIMISINPPYTNMILSEYKPFEYRKKILKNIKNGDRLYVYETKNHNGQGKVVGEALIGNIYRLYYGTPSINDGKIVRERFSHIKNLYYKYCDIKNYKPNNNEGWFSSKRFKKYLMEIGFENDGGEIGNINYALELVGIIKYETPIDISYFMSPTTGNILKQPPQNMCYCDKLEEV